MTAGEQRLRTLLCPVAALFVDEEQSRTPVG